MSGARPAPTSDADARRRIRESLHETLLVEASAGTGKTSELVRRIVAVLRAGLTTMDRIAAVTFTHKAAGELKLRLRQELDRARAEAQKCDPHGRDVQLLEDSLEHLEEASIGTIHSFCAQILRERPVEARVDPAFDEVSEADAETLFDATFQAWFQRKLAQSAPGLKRALSRLAWREDTDSGEPIEALSYAAHKLIEWRDHPASWRRDPFPRDTELHTLLASVRHLATNTNIQVAADFAAWAERSELAGRLDLDSLEARLLKLARDLSNWKTKVSAKDKALRDSVVFEIQQFRLRADADLAAALREEMLELVASYQDRKQQSGKLDFQDLLLMVRDLIRSNSEVRHFLQQRYSHLFVDEFQDTDPIQAEMLILLSAGDPAETAWLNVTPTPGKLFLVGDPKQSIYKFRRADMALYQQVRERLIERGVGLVYLSRSFRSVRPIQQCVNAAFASQMSGDPHSGQASYVPLEEHTPPIPGQPAIIALPAPRPYGQREITKSSINECLPYTLVAFVEWLLHYSQWKVRDLDSGALVPLKPRHICLLFRRFINYGDDLTRPYVRDLEARGIRHLLVGAKSFHQREEVETLRAALTAIEWPEDELSVYAALKGSLFSIEDAALLRYREEIGKLHPFHNLPENPEPAFEPITQALSLLANLHRGRNRRPLADTVNSLLEATRAHAAFALRPAGHQVLANAHRISDLARRFEAGGGTSFRSFVEDLAAQAGKIESAEAPVLEDGADGVRLMTVHNAKGLEFPIVILADMTANLTSREPDRYVDGAAGLCATRLLNCSPVELREHAQEEMARERAEGVRVAYVAATRARDLLVVPTVGDRHFDGWLEPLNKAIYPASPAFRHARPAPNCPDFGDASVLHRPNHFLGEKESSVKPGLHTPEQGDHEVVWWDPATLRLHVEPNYGIRGEDLLVPNGPLSLANSKLYDDWSALRSQRLEAGRHRHFEILLAAEAISGPQGFSCPLSVEFLPKAARRPSGKRFGALVHAILRDVPLDAGRRGVEPLSRAHARLLGATRAEEIAATEAVLNALTSTLLDRARQAPESHREWPVQLPLAPGQLLEGVIDLAFRDAAGWKIVDFKTDADTPDLRDRYAAQLSWYAYALSRLTGQPVQACLLSI